MGYPASNVKTVIVQIPLGALGTAKTRHVPCPVNGRVRLVMWASDVAVDDTNTLTFAINGTAITGGALTLAALTTVAGMILSAEPTAAYTCKRGENLSVATDGGGTVGDGMALIVIEQA